MQKKLTITSHFVWS